MNLSDKLLALVKLNEAVRKMYYAKALLAAELNKSEAARLLRIKRPTFDYGVRKYRLEGKTARELARIASKLSDKVYPLRGTTGTREAS